jgi:uncharacterized protein (DUF2062 family)
VPEWAEHIPRLPGRDSQACPRGQAAKSGASGGACVTFTMVRKKNKGSGHPRRERARRWGRYIYLRLVRQNDEPNKVAKGVGLGVFLGIFPTFGVGAILAVLIATWVKWNRASAALGTFIMNPFFNPFFLSLSVVVGNLLVPSRSQITVESFRGGKLWSGFFHAVPVYLLGNILVSTIFAALAYWLTLGAVKAYRQRRAAARQASKAPEASPPEPQS